MTPRKYIDREDVLDIMVALFTDIADEKATDMKLVAKYTKQIEKLPVQDSRSMLLMPDLTFMHCMDLR